MWQETFVTYLKVFPGHVPGRNAENHQGSMPVVRIHNFQVQVLCIATILVYLCETLLELYNRRIRD